MGPQGVDDLSMSTARGALTTGSYATPPGEAIPPERVEGSKRWMLHCGRLLDGSCVAVAAAVDRCGAAFCGHCGLSCCYADVDVVSVVWGRVGDCFRVAPVSLPATSHTHPWCTPSPLRPHEVLATSASAVVGTGTVDGGGQRIREREEERRRPTPSSSPAEPHIQRSQQKLR